MYRLVCALVVGSLLLTGGCQRVHQERTAQVEPGNVYVLTVDAPRSDQQVTVTAASPGVPINVYLVLEKDVEEARQALDRDKKPARPLAAQEKTESATLQATVPAQNGYAVVLTSAAGKKAEVKLHLAGK